MDELPPDRLEKKIRLGCGGVAGLVIGLGCGLLGLDLKGWFLWLFVAVLVAAFARLALKQGDRFWLELMDVFKWW
ncbi:MAG TPA: hypothetical protein VFS47_15610 [Steroidobacteraceae bacterium]|nr:hypothetical protein [Steroidobacteraceae bacterium]